MFELFNRVRSIDIKKLTPVQWVMIAVGIIIALWVLNTVVSIAVTLLPIVLVGLIAYAAFRILTSRSEAPADLQKQKRDDNIQQATASTAKAARQVDTVISTKVEPITNRLDDAAVDPVTGVILPDLKRLEEQEAQQIQAPKKADPDEIARQLEERRKRLGQ